MRVVHAEAPMRGRQAIELECDEEENDPSAKRSLDATVQNGTGGVGCGTLSPALIFTGVIALLSMRSGRRSYPKR